MPGSIAHVVAAAVTARDEKVNCAVVKYAAFGEGETRTASSVSSLYPSPIAALLSCSGRDNHVHGLSSISCPLHPQVRKARAAERLVSFFPPTFSVSRSRCPSTLRKGMMVWGSCPTPGAATSTSEGIYSGLNVHAVRSCG